MTVSHDDFSRVPVSAGKLRPWWYLLILEMGVMISIPVFVVGGQLGLGLTLHDLVIATFGGALILGIIGGLTARLGAITRCSTPLIARYTFGRKGTALITIVLGFSLIGWWGVQSEMFAHAVIGLAHQLFAIDLPESPLIIASGAAMIVTAALGFRAIGKISYIAVPLLLAGIAYALSALGHPGTIPALTAYDPGVKNIGLGAAAATVTGGFIVGAAANPDYARFARTTRHAVGYALTDYAIIYPSLLIACGIIAVINQTTDVLVHLVPANFTWFVFVMMMFATWAANDCNLYSSSLALAAVIKRWQRPVLAIAAGSLGIVLALAHVAEHMITFLSLLSILIAPISGVIVMGNLRRREPYTQAELDGVPDWRWKALTAWGVAVIAGFMTTGKAAFGLALLSLTTVPTLDAVLVAVAVMGILQAIARKDA